MNLYLDDVRNPQTDGWTIVRTVDAAKALLITGDVECATLDHDLGACASCSEDAMDPLVICSHMQTGYDLVKWMAETGHWPQRKPLVHSANPVGRRNMEATIERYFPR